MKIAAGKSIKPQHLTLERSAEGSLDRVAKPCSPWKVVSPCSGEKPVSELWNDKILRQIGKFSVKGVFKNNFKSIYKGRLYIIF